MRRSIVTGEFYTIIRIHEIHLAENNHTAVGALRANDAHRIVHVHSDALRPATPKRALHGLLQLCALGERVIGGSNREQCNQQKKQMKESH